MCFRSYWKACCYYYKAQYNKYLLNSYLVQEIVLVPRSNSKAKKTWLLSSGSLQCGQMVKTNRVNNWRKVRVRYVRIKLQIKITTKVKKEDLCLLVISDSRTVMEEGF